MQRIYAHWPVARRNANLDTEKVATMKPVKEVVVVKPGMVLIMAAKMSVSV